MAYVFLILQIWLQTCRGCTARLDKLGAWEQDTAILDMCNKFPVMQKMPRHVTNWVSRSYFLGLCVPCTSVNMHYVFFTQCQPFHIKFCSLLSASPQVKQSVQNYGGCSFGPEAEAENEGLMTLSEVTEVWIRIGWPNYFNREQKLLLPCCPPRFQRHMVKVKSYCSDSNCCGLHTFSHIVSFQSYTAVTGTREISRAVDACG